MPFSLWLTFFLNIFPESKATKCLSPHSYFSVVAAEKWRGETQSPGEKASPRKAGWYPCHHCHPFAMGSFPLPGYSAYTEGLLCSAGSHITLGERRR